jgi:hypothetical protein
MNVSIGRVKLPVFAIVAAIPAAARKCRESAADNKAAASPGGSKVTAAEVLEDVLAFVAALGEEAMPAILKANGVAG